MYPGGKSRREEAERAYGEHPLRCAECGGVVPWIRANRGRLTCTMECGEAFQRKRSAEGIRRAKALVREVKASQEQAQQEVACNAAYNLALNHEQLEVLQRVLEARIGVLRSEERAYPVTAKKLRQAVVVTQVVGLLGRVVTGVRMGPTTSTQVDTPQ